MEARRRERIAGLMGKEKDREDRVSRLVGNI